MPNTKTFSAILKIGNPNNLSAPLSTVAYLDTIDITTTTQRRNGTTIQSDNFIRRSQNGSQSVKIDAKGRTINGNTTLLKTSLTAFAYPITITFNDNTSISGTFWIEQFQDSLRADAMPSVFSLRLISEGVIT